MKNMKHNNATRRTYNANAAAARRAENAANTNAAAAKTEKSRKAACKENAAAVMISVQIERKGA